MTATKANAYREALATITEQAVEAMQTPNGWLVGIDAIPEILIQLCGIMSVMTSVLINIAEQKGD